MGPEQSALTEGDACAGQDEPWSRHVVKEQRLLRGMDTPPARGSENLESLLQSSSRLLLLQRQFSLPNLFHKEHGCPGPRVAQSSALCFPSNRSATSGTQTSQGATALSLIALLWRNQPWVSELFQLLEAAPWPIPLRRDLLSQANGTIWHPWPELWALHVWPLNGSLSGLPERVLNMMAEARAPSTWRLYALKWSVFSTWCQTTPRPLMTLWLSLCLVYSLDSPGSYYHVSLGVESFHVIARRDCTLMQYEWIIERECIVTSVPWDMKRVLRSWPCYELHSVASLKKIWNAAAQPLI